MSFTGWQIVVLIACIIAGYLFGSINFAIIFTRLFKKGDIRDYGSGNAGMTNVLRTVGKTAASLTLVGDFCKGIISVLLLRLLFIFVLGEQTPILFEYFVAYAALLGHVFPIFYGFKGGKGILVSAGAMLILSPWSLLICLAGFILLAAITKYISVGSIVAGILYPISNAVVTYFKFGAINWLWVLLALPISAFIIYLHRANIKRLINGTESKVSFKKK